MWVFSLPFSQSIYPMAPGGKHTHTHTHTTNNYECCTCQKTTPHSPEWVVATFGYNKILLCQTHTWPRTHIHTNRGANKAATDAESWRCLLYCLTTSTSTSTSTTKSCAWFNYRISWFVKFSHTPKNTQDIARDSTACPPPLPGCSAGGQRKSKLKNRFFP